jgi:cytochrome c-type biogenesis protein CcmE
MSRQLKFIAGIAVIITTVAVLVYTAVDQTKMYMITVAEFTSARSAFAGTTLRIAGRVQENSMKWDGGKRDLHFTLADIEGGGELAVHYTGILPDMFAEGRDVVVEGPYTDDAVFQASTVLTSCPSKYEADQAGHVKMP